MKILVLSMLITTQGFAQSQTDKPAAVKPPANQQQQQQQPTPVKPETESGGIRDRIERQLDRMTFSANELSDRVKIDIKRRYGFDVNCNGKVLWVFGGLDDDSCYLGMQNLSKALGSIDPNMGNGRFDEVDIEIRPAGHWQRLTLSDKKMRIPYNASPDQMSVFINDQLKVLYGTSLRQLEERNKKLAEEIQKRFFIGAERGPEIEAVEYYDGLVKFALAAQLFYGGKKPSQEQARKLGFETVVLTKKDKGLYQNNGELRIDVDLRQRPGKMYEHMIGQVIEYDDDWFDKRPLRYTWVDVQDFRKARYEARATQKWLSGVLKQKEINCVLNREFDHAVSIAQCKEGLERLQKAVAQYGPPQKGIPFNRIWIGDTFLHRHYYLREQNAILLDYAMNIENMYEAAIKQGDND